MHISKDTVIVVTGSTRGLGRALVEDFARKGANVYGTYRSSSKEAEEIVAEFPNATMVRVDNTDPNAIKNFIQQIINDQKRIDILINNAGTVHERKMVTDLSLENWQNLINVHLTGAFIYVKNVLPSMIEKNSGLIINVSSRFGLLENAKPGFASLNVVKAGLNMFTKVLFKELEGTKIRVNSVLPAPTKTDFLNEVFTEEEMVGMSDKGILGELPDFVELVNEVIEDESLNGEFVLDKRLRN